MAGDAQDLSQRGGAQRRGRNAPVALLLAGVAVGMVGLAFASVPLYRLFCQVTGFGGTPQVASSAPEEISERVMKVRFNADVSPALPWAFQPEVREMEVKVGEQKLIFFRARNLSARETSGTATFNVTPLKTGQYFSKVQCFCFNEQRLAPGQEVEMGVSFFVDPAIVDNPGLDDVTTITLSYTFFRSLDELDPSNDRDSSAASETDSARREAAGS
ncbi:MAG: cytochrome c oxidase assembly protein [Kiloniellales bacterium]